MKGTTITMLAAAALAAMPSLCNAQGMSVTHETSRGFELNTYWSAPGATAFFKVTESTTAHGGQTSAATAQGYALIATGGGFVAYVAGSGDSQASVYPSSPSFNTPGQGSGAFPARRMEYAFGPFGLQIVSVKTGTIVANSTLENPTLIEISRRPYHNQLSLPGIGLLFALNSNYVGKFAFHPTGSGGMCFIPDAGPAESIVPNGTPVSSASWMGRFHSVETEVIRP